VYIAGAGILSALGTGCEETVQALQKNSRSLRPLQLFPLQNSDPMPVGQIPLDTTGEPLPRTHTLAFAAAREAMADSCSSLDAIVLGTTTGGILSTEALLKKKETAPEAFRYHGLTTVARHLASRYDCCGPVLTVSTACSSGAVAISIALALLRSGQADTVLAGGVDSLCRLTYFGFHSLQLVDPEGARPMDANRRGMSVAEGAAMLLLSTKKPDTPLAEIAGYGLSCDAYHPATPHPEGKGAGKAMRAALDDAAIPPCDIDYINLHGTGTPDNDRAESKAIQNLFHMPPPLSSIKGATGHSLAASGAIEAVVAGLAISRGLLPANTGLITPDPKLLCPQKTPEQKNITAVLSNSFGFGGNNGALVICRPGTSEKNAAVARHKPLTVCGTACLTGRGNLADTISALQQGKNCAGALPLKELSAHLPPRTIRRLKRLARMSLSLALAAHTDSGQEKPPTSVFMGTGWGALSETHDFLSRLQETEEQFPSPTDFIGSVHNGPAGQVALFFKATGANITCSGGDYSFEQALLSADLLAGSTPCFVLGADEGHEQFSPLFDPSATPGSPLADGGAAFTMTRQNNPGQISLKTSFYRESSAKDCLAALVQTLGGKERLDTRFNLILAGIPAASRRQAECQLQKFQDIAGKNTPIVDYRKYTGQFASASAVAAAIAVDIVRTGTIPAAFTKSGNNASLRGGVLILGLGNTVTAMECYHL